MDFKHIPVLLRETLEGLSIKPDGIYVDGTAGGAGHSCEIAKRLSSGRLVALDQDPDAVKTATERLNGLPAVVVKTNFRHMRDALDGLGIDLVDGIMLDIGVSSFQLDNRERGFSFHDDAALDMRMSKEGPTAADLVNSLDVPELTRILRDFGEEKFAYKIALKICEERNRSPITTTGRLAEIIASAVPAVVRRQGNPSRKSFQALRIAVNDELGALTDGIQAAWSCLKPGGRLAIITFHSLEDRIVKQKFKELSTGCVCPPDIPICVCGRKPEGKLITNKPITASEEELLINQRSRSAKLRVIEKI
ncbi:MAG: 16S rRNA (cytosine(1402)-N(4))-methyltransferase RsmH [Acutalibacteraceae bacterium]|nr:16S rRNA (cytosine(1402)-N(4))-methyltransferase RsmH [Acutalibacteraceae bacterium]